MLWAMQIDHQIRLISQSRLLGTNHQVTDASKRYKTHCWCAKSRTVALQQYQSCSAAPAPLVAPDASEITGARLSLHSASCLVACYLLTARVQQASRQRALNGRRAHTADLLCGRWRAAGQPGAECDAWAAALAAAGRRRRFAGQRAGQRAEAPAQDERASHGRRGWWCGPCTLMPVPLALADDTAGSAYPLLT